MPKTTENTEDTKQASELDSDLRHRFWNCQGVLNNYGQYDISTNEKVDNMKNRWLVRREMEMLKKNEKEMLGKQTNKQHCNRNEECLSMGLSADWT